MSKITKTLEKLLRGNADANIPFGDLCALLLYLGFVGGPVAVTTFSRGTA
jgi:hypothetical protein